MNVSEQEEGRFGGPPLSSVRVAPLGLRGNAMYGMTAL